MHDFLHVTFFLSFFLQRTFQELLIAFLISYSSLQQHLFFASQTNEGGKKERNEEQ
jgi:hypothetical protein